MLSLLCSDGITLSRSFPLLDGIPSSNSRYPYSNATHGSQAPKVIARDAGLRRYILQNTRCASIRGENASHMSGFPSSRIRKSPLSTGNEVNVPLRLDTGQTVSGPKAPTPCHCNLDVVANDRFVSSRSSAEGVIEHIPRDARSGNVIVHSSRRNAHHK